MNKANRASLEASRDLVKAGIVLKTEKCWRFTSDNKAPSVTDVEPGRFSTDIPDPCFVEVWMEFGDDVYITRHWDRENRVYVTRATLNFLACPEYKNANPTDALIYLLIWVRKEKP